MILPIRISTIISIGGCCPFQCFALTDDGRELYVRYRGGRFRVYLSYLPGGNPLDLDAYILRNDTIGEQFDGALDPLQMVELTAGLIEWPTDLTPTVEQEEDDRT